MLRPWLKLPHRRVFFEKFNEVSLEVQYDR